MPHLRAGKRGLTSPHPSLPQTPMEKKKNKQPKTTDHALLHFGETQNVEAHGKESGTGGVLDLSEDPFPLLLLFVIPGERQTESYGEESISPASLQLLPVVAGALARGVTSRRAPDPWEPRGGLSPGARCCAVPG